MIKPQSKKSSPTVRAWTMPAVVAVLTVTALELAQRVSLWAALALAAAVVVVGILALGRRE